MEKSSELNFTLIFKFDRENSLKLENLDKKITFLEITTLLNNKMNNKEKQYDYVYKGNLISNLNQNIEELNIKNGEVIATIKKKMTNSVSNFIFNIENLTGTPLRIENISDFNSLFNSFINSTSINLGEINNTPSENVDRRQENNSLTDNSTNDSTISENDEEPSDREEEVDDNSHNDSNDNSHNDDSSIQSEDNQEGTIETSINSLNLENFFNNQGFSVNMIYNNNVSNPEETLASMGYDNIDLNRMALEYNNHDLSLSIEWLENLR